MQLLKDLLTWIRELDPWEVTLGGVLVSVVYWGNPYIVGFAAGFVAGY